MKKLFVLVVFFALALAGVYIQSALVFSESGANRFLDELEDLSLHGRNAEYCARLHDDMQVSISDRSAEPPAEFSGGKRELCNYVEYATRGLDLLGLSTQAQRHDFTVQRSWLHPWTAEVSYSESRTTHMTKLHATLRTEGEDQWTLVQTFEGVKALRLTSKTRLAGN